MIRTCSKTLTKPRQKRKRSHLSFSFFLAWLLRLWSDFCSKLPNRAFSSFALQGKGSKRQSGGIFPQQKASEKRVSHLSRQVLGSESSPLHMVFGVCSPSKSSSSAQSSAGLSSVREDYSLYSLCSVTSRLPANGGRGASGTGDFLTQIFPQFRYRITLTVIEGNQQSVCFLFLKFSTNILQ